MKVGEKINSTPLLLKFGVALALSFAGFFFSSLKSGRNKRTLPPPTSPHSSGDLGGRAGRIDEFHPKNTSASSCSIAPAANEKHEEKYMSKVSCDNCEVSFSRSSKRNDKDGYLLPEFNDLTKELDYAAAATIGLSTRKNVDSPGSDVKTAEVFRSAEKDETQQEIKHLRSMVRMLRERKRNLEVQLLEFYGLKEQDAAVMEFQNRLKLNNMLTKVFSLKIESLQADNQRLEAQVSDYAKVVAELEDARAKIELLKKKLRFEAEQNKEQILNLQQRVEKLQDQEYIHGASDADTHLKLTRLKDLEEEREELKKSNVTLQLELSELTRRLESTQILANSVLKDPEAEALKKASEWLRQENETLKKEIEQLEADRCSDIEELVYFRWINACLRYELRNYQPSSGKTVAKDLSKSLSPKSEEKAKELILEYANTEVAGDKERAIVDIDCDGGLSSQASLLTDECDECYADNSSTTKTNSSRKNEFLSKPRSQRVSTVKHGSTEDGDSARFSSSILVGNDSRNNNRLRSSSLSSSRGSSIDILRMRSLKEENVKEIDGVRRNSDVGGSAESALKENLKQESYSSEKSELLKYAEALKSFRGRTLKLHSRSSSYSSF